MKWYLRFEFIIVLSAHILLALVLTYFASSISHFNDVLYRDLNSIYFNFQIEMKLKVSFKVGNYAMISEIFIAVNELYLKSWK